MVAIDKNSPTSVGLILWQAWMSVQNFITIHPIVDISVFNKMVDRPTTLTIFFSYICISPQVLQVSCAVQRVTFSTLCTMR